MPTPREQKATPTQPFATSSEGASRLRRGAEIAMEKAVDHLPRAWRPRGIVLMALLATLLVLDLALAIALGVTPSRAITIMFPALVKISGVAWFLLYPALLAWREIVARRGQEHLTEPDFVARPPKVEPVVWVLGLLGVVVWIGAQVTAQPAEGAARVAGYREFLGYFVGMALGFGSVGVGVLLFVRPTYAAAFLHERAIKQYLEGGLHNVKKGNTQRARRLFERALEEVRGTPRMAEVLEHLKAATHQEAGELRLRGLEKHASDLVQAQRVRTAVQPTDPGKADGQDNARTMAREILGASSNTPVQLEFGEVKIAQRSGDVPSGKGDAGAMVERAKILADHGRAREGVEILVLHALAVPRTMAQEAAKQYISQGMLRSADVLYEAMKERQIPEFYKAVAAEWFKDRGPDAPAGPLMRLADLLVEVDEIEAAARIACRAALSASSPRATREDAGRRASVMCKQLGTEPPPEILELMGDLEAAAHAYDVDRRQEDAFRCYRLLVDRRLEAKEGAARIIPLLSKMFSKDPTALTDRHYGLLADHVIEQNLSGAIAVKILLAHRKRHEGDPRIAIRLFQLHAQAGQVEEALSELQHRVRQQGSKPEALLADHRLLVQRFPEHRRARSALIYALLHAGRVDDARAELGVLLAQTGASPDPAEAISLIEALFEWGCSDIELKKALGHFRIDLGETEKGLLDLEQYVLDGGRDPKAITRAQDLLSENLVLPSGGPDYLRQVRLARFLLHRGDPEGALPFFEVSRLSRAHKLESELGLARAYLALGRPRDGVAVLREAIAGRALSETLELHYEVARSYEAMGKTQEMQKIDGAIDRVDDGFRERYEASRNAIGLADTHWVPGEGDAAHEGPLATEVTGPDLKGSLEWEDAPGDDVRPALEVKAEVDKDKDRIRDLDVSGDSVTDLEFALAPRYRLVRKLGAGGMGEVHLSEDVELGRLVAVKVLRRTLASDLFLAKFRDEARIVAQLAHVNIVSIFDLGNRGGWSYIVMEYVDGPDLGSLLKDKKTVLERPRLLELLARVADGMAYAHGKNVVHRDIKPANILVGPGDLVKVTDFGIAKILDPSGDETAFSANGMHVGTVNYMAPEQIAGKAVDARTDIYLLGTTIYYALSRTYPFVGEGVPVQKLRRDPSPLRTHVRDISGELEACVMRCLARRPADRFQNMRELGDALRAVPEASAV